jgi:peroxiredoxin
MEAYRDQYATLFNNGRKVIVLAVSVDPDTTLNAWARESSFPFLFGSDVDQAVGKMYGSTRDKLDSRNLFVIGPDGRITYKVINFNVLFPGAYTDLGKAVTQAAGSGPPGDEY